MDFPGGPVVKNLPASARDAGDLAGSLGRGDTLEEKMAPHSRILACKIIWTEEPGGLQITGLPRVRPDLATERTHCT